MGISLTRAKLQILHLLDDEPRHGYVISDELDRHGSTVYEHLHKLEDANYIDGREEGRKIVYSLTEKGELILEAERLDE